MSEFKFACPVCGQHITADSSTSGGQIECPTCFQKIVVPQAPTSQDGKFILSASQVAKPRPASAEAASQLGPLQPSSSRSSVPATIALVVLVCAAGAALFVFRNRILKFAHPQPPAVTNTPPPQPAAPVALNTTYPFPTNIIWTLELTNAVLPDTVAAGRVHGCGFVCERTTLEGGTLSLRQGRTWPPDLGFTILLTARQGEDLAGKTVEITPDRTPPLPRVVLRWKDDQQQPQKVTINGGYALKVAFGQPAHGHLPGRIYLCLPDPARSFVGGAFDAEIRRPKTGPPRTPKPKS